MNIQKQIKQICNVHIIQFDIVIMISHEYKKTVICMKKQAEAELCQAQVKLEGIHEVGTEFGWGC